MANHECRVPKTGYEKHYIPLESNPDGSTRMIYNLDVSPALEFVDVYSINDPELLAFVSRPASALVLVFPTTNTYEERAKSEESQRLRYTGYGDDETVMWFRQSINNACGLYGILHAVSNGEAKSHVGEWMMPGKGETMSCRDPEQCHEYLVFR